MNNALTTIVISGASSGLGAALAVAFAQEKVVLHLSGRSLERLQLVAARCEAKGAETHCHAMDICDDGAVRDWIARIAAKGSLDLVICNAGITDSHGADGELEDMPKARSVIETNLLGTISLASNAATVMQKQKQGQIVMVSSLAALQPLADGPSYAASKAGINAYAEALHAYLAESGVHVGVICPGYIRTPMADQFKSWRPFEISPEQAAQKIVGAITQKRSFYVFPWILRFSILLGKLLPWSLRRHTTKAFNYQRD